MTEDKTTELEEPTQNAWSEVGHMLAKQILGTIAGFVAGVAVNHAYDALRERSNSTKSDPVPDLELENN